MIRVLIVDDSAVNRQLLEHILSASPGIRVIASVASGEAAIAAARELMPDLITMDVHMRGMDGLQATRHIMENTPTRVLLVTGSRHDSEEELAHAANQAGALAVVKRPRGPRHPDYEAGAQQLVQAVKLLVQAKVVRRWPQRRTPDPASAGQAAVHVPRNIEVIAIGASTGGPLVLKTVLAALPKAFPVPIVIVQHISPGFTHDFASWLGLASGFPVQLARHQERPLPGVAYVAPDGAHLRLDADKRFLLTQDECASGHRPAVSPLFCSVAQYYGAAAIGVLLSGMGRDGADALKKMRDRGAATIVQDRQSSIVYGMPQAALDLDAVTYVLPDIAIGAKLAALVYADRLWAAGPQPAA